MRVEAMYRTPWAMPGQVVEVDPDAPQVQRYLENGVLRKVDDDTPLTMVGIFEEKRVEVEGVDDEGNPTTSVQVFSEKVGEEPPAYDDSPEAEWSGPNHEDVQHDTGPAEEPLPEGTVHQASGSVSLDSAEGGEE